MGLRCALWAPLLKCLRNDDDDFTNESLDTLKSFSLFLAVQTISKLKMERSVKLEIEI